MLKFSSIDQLCPPLTMNGASWQKEVAAGVSTDYILSEDFVLMRITPVHFFVVGVPRYEKFLKPFHFSLPVDAQSAPPPPATIVLLQRSQGTTRRFSIPSPWSLQFVLSSISRRNYGFKTHHVFREVGLMEYKLDIIINKCPSLDESYYIFGCSEVARTWGIDVLLFTGSGEQSLTRRTWGISKPEFMTSYKWRWVCPYCRIN